MKGVLFSMIVHARSKTASVVLADAYCFTILNVFMVPSAVTTFIT